MRNLGASFKNITDKVTRCLHRGSSLIFSILLFISFCSNREWNNPFDPHAEMPISEWSPSNLNIKQISIRKAKLSWYQDEEKIDGFKIDKRIEGNEWYNEYCVIEKGKTEWIDTLVKPGKLNSYRIYAFAGRKNSLMTLENLYASFNPPNGFKIIAPDRNRIKLIWSYNERDVDGFKIDRKVGTNNWNIEYACLGQNIREFIDENVSLNNIYCYRLYAYASNNNSQVVESWIYLEPEHYITVPDDYATIQEAINNAIDGDTIIVYPGEYYENINCVGKSISIGSLFLPTKVDSFINNTIINGSNKSRVISFKNIEGTLTLLCGFTITNGLARSYQVSSGAGIYCSSSKITLKNLIIKDNKASHGGGLYASNNSSIELNNVVISKNYSTWGGGIKFWRGCSANLINVTIANNESSIDGGGLYCYDNEHISTVKFINCILWNNHPNEISLYDIPNNLCNVYISYSNIKGGISHIVAYDSSKVHWLDGNIDLNPIFISEPDNLHIDYYSPCINAGSPDIKYQDPDGTRNDMGAYGGPEGDW